MPRVIRAPGVAPAMAILLVLQALACGGGPARPAPAAPAPAATPTDEATASGASGPSNRAPAGGPALTEAECNQLADHLVDVGIADSARAAGDAASGSSYTPADAEAAKRELRQSLQPACARVSRQALTCALAATTGNELRACD